MRCWRPSIKRRGRKGHPEVTAESPSSRIRLCILSAVFCVLCVHLTACNGEPGVVRGIVSEAIDRDLAEIETLRIRDDGGRLWTFTTDGPLEKNGAHLRLHQVLGQTIEVRYEEREGRLVAVSLRD